MQRRASSRYGAVIACVGQTSMQRVQVPQCAVAGGSIRALETESERHRRTNAELSRIRASLEAAGLAENDAARA